MFPYLAAHLNMNAVCVCMYDKYVFKHFFQLIQINF